MSNLKWAMTLAIFGILSLSPAMAQDTTFYDSDMEEVSSRSESTYYRIITQMSQSMWIIKDFYSENDALEMQKGVSSLDPEVNQGMATWYYKNGQVKESGLYLRGEASGKHFKYYENGALRSEYEYSEMRPVRFQYYSPGGDPLLDENGTGIVRGEKDEEGDFHFFEYENYEIKLSGYYIKGDEQNVFLDTNAEYPGGVEAYTKFLRSNLRYPAQARRKEIEGKVYVTFVVAKDGEISDVRITRGIGGGCDEEAVRVIKKTKTWSPGTQKGRPVKQRMIIPIVFKLG